MTSLPDSKNGWNAYEWRLGVSVFMVRALIRRRQLAYYKVGRRIVLDVADLERYLLKHRVEAVDL